MNKSPEELSAELEQEVRADMREAEHLDMVAEWAKYERSAFKIEKEINAQRKVRVRAALLEKLKAEVDEMTAAAQAADKKPWEAQAAWAKVSAAWAKVNAANKVCNEALKGDD